MISRRGFLALVALGAIIQHSARAEQDGRMPRVGLLLSGSPSDADPKVLEFRQGLRDLGYVEGQTISVVARWADVPAHLPETAIELIKSRIDVIVTQGSAAAQAAKRATRTIPIVMATSGDPVAVGLVASLARPGGNVTGQSIMAPELHQKRLQFLKEIVPGLSRVAVLWNPANPAMAPERRAAESAAITLNLKLQPVEVRDPHEIERAFQEIASGRATAFFMPDDPLFNAHREEIAKMAVKNHLPAIYGMSVGERTDELVNYGPNLSVLFRSATVFVDKILRGARPAELPVEQISRFELVINLKAAKALGIKIPQSILIRADRVIE